MEVVMTSALQGYCKEDCNCRNRQFLLSERLQFSDLYTFSSPGPFPPTRLLLHTLQVPTLRSPFHQVLPPSPTSVGSAPGVSSQQDPGFPLSLAHLTVRSFLIDTPITRARTIIFVELLPCARVHTGCFSWYLIQSPLWPYEVRFSILQGKKQDRLDSINCSRSPS